MDPEEHNHEPFNWFARLYQECLVDESARLFGLLSLTHAELQGTATWVTPDGEEVMVTNVCSRSKMASYAFTDAICVGEVVRCVRGLSGGKWIFLEKIFRNEAFPCDPSTATGEDLRNIARLYGIEDPSVKDRNSQ